MLGSSPCMSCFKDVTVIGSGTVLNKGLSHDPGWHTAATLLLSGVQSLLEPLQS